MPFGISELSDLGPEFRALYEQGRSLKEISAITGIPYWHSQTFQTNPKKTSNTLGSLKGNQQPQLHQPTRPCKASHGEKIWAYQKLPTEPQILAYELHRQGGNGIIFDSTKLAGHQNIALFFKNNDAAKEALEIILV